MYNHKGSISPARIGAAIIFILAIFFLLAWVFGFFNYTHAQVLVSAPSTKTNFGWFYDLIAPKLFEWFSAAIMAFIAYLFHRWTGKKMEDSRRDALQTAVTNAAGLGRRRLGDLIHTIDFDVHDPRIAMLIAYVKGAAPEGVKHWGLSDEEIAKKIEAKVPQVVPPVTAIDLTKFQPIAGEVGHIIGNS